jgi:alkylation response protein AidB-like acyl-CoA dehydrogenase
MEFTFSDEQQEISGLARRILGDLVSHDRLKEIEADPEWFDRKVWDELAKAGLLGIALPDDVGGGGFGVFELCLVLEQIGRAVAPVPALPALVMGALPLAAFGTAEQRAALLPGVIAGDTILTAALVEPGNDEPSRPVVSAVADGGGWRLSGVKTCVPVVHLAARVLVPATTSDGVIVALVDPRATGVAARRQESTNHEPWFRLELDGVRVGAADVVGAPDTGAGITQWIAERTIVGQCAVMLGVAEQSLAMTAEYAKGRVQFERPIATFQAVGQRAADAYIDVEGIRLTMWQAAWQLAAGLPAVREVAVAKFWAADAGQRVVHAAQHLHGGIGVDVDYPLHRYFLWAKALEAVLGGATHQLLRLGAAIAAEPV